MPTSSSLETLMTGCIVKHLTLPDLNFSKQYLRCTSVHIPQYSEPVLSQLTQCVQQLGSNVLMHSYSLTREVLESTGVSFSTLHLPQLLGQSFPTSSNVLQDDFIVNPLAWSRCTIMNWMHYATSKRCTK